MTITSTTTPHAELDAYITSLGIGYTARFIKQSLSRNANEKAKTLNWRVSLRRNAHTHATDYMQGIGHVPGYCSGGSAYEHRLLRAEQQKANESGQYPCVFLGTGKGYRAASIKDYTSRMSHRVIYRDLPTPLCRDVLHSLMIDSQTVDGYSFEQWCSEFGYDTDSIKALDMYNACQSTARSISRLFSQVELKQLQELFQDY